MDIPELLQRYQYGKNDVDNQVSHIFLFEIIIDRCVSAMENDRTPLSLLA